MDFVLIDITEVAMVGILLFLGWFFMGSRKDNEMAIRRDLLITAGIVVVCLVVVLVSWSVFVDNNTIVHTASATPTQSAVDKPTPTPTVQPSEVVSTTTVVTTAPGVVTTQTVAGVRVVTTAPGVKTTTTQTATINTTATVNTTATERTTDHTTERTTDTVPGPTVTVTSNGPTVTATATTVVTSTVPGPTVTVTAPTATVQPASLVIATFQGECNVIGENAVSASGEPLRCKIEPPNHISIWEDANDGKPDYCAYFDVTECYTLH